MNQMRTRGDDAVERIEYGVREARARVKRMDEQVVQFAREKPLLATFSALAVGFVIGRFFAKL